LLRLVGIRLLWLRLLGDWRLRVVWVALAAEEEEDAEDDEADCYGASADRSTNYGSVVG
jgi:hypothetical protein